MRQLESRSRRVDEVKVGREILARSERRAMDEKVKTAELAIDLREHVRDLRVVGHVAAAGSADW